MMNVKEAVKIAIRYVKIICGTEYSESILLEEVVLSDDEKTWHVTISGFLDTERQYWSIYVDDINEQVIMHENRTVEGVSCEAR